MNARRYDIDWLRVFATLTVFIFHCTRFFCSEDWHLKVPVEQQSEVLVIVRSFFISIWFMELFCLVSGFAAWHALQKRSGGQFLLERVKRLLVPLYTVGLFLLVVPQAYFEYYSHGIISAGMWEALPGYYLSLPETVFDFGGKNYADPIQVLPYGFSGHLWFIQMLFMITLITLPVLLYLRSEKGRRLIERAAGWTGGEAGIFIFVVPLAVVRIALAWLPQTSERTWGDFAWYALFFVIGYILAADERFTISYKRAGKASLVVWILSFWLVGAFFRFVLGFDTDAGQGVWWQYLIWHVDYSLFSWGAVVFWLSLAANRFNFTNGLLTYSNEAVLPFFLLHQTVILCVGWFVLPWDTSNLVKFFVILVVSFGLIMAIYEVLIRHIGFMRFLFGMPPKKKPAAALGAG